MRRQDFITHSARDTIDLGTRIGRALRGGEVFAVHGPLGSGKTHLIKGIAAGAGATGLEQVNSPTFVLVNEYRGRLDLFHIDAYRLNSGVEFEMLGFDDFLYPTSVVLVEWADRVADILAPLERVSIRIRHLSESRRSISLQNHPDYLEIGEIGSPQ